MSKQSSIALTTFLTKFHELVEDLFYPKKKTNLEELEELDSKLQVNFNITILEIAESEYHTIAPTIEKIDSTTLDKIALLIYSSVNSKKETALSTKLKTNKTLNQRLMQLILLSEKKSNKLSLERNNLKNSIEQQLLKR